MATGTANFPSRPFRLRLEVNINWQSGSRVSVRSELWVDKMSYSPTWSANANSTAHTGLQNAVTGNWGPSSFDFRNGNNFLLIRVDTETNVNNDGGFWADAFANIELLGNTSVGFWAYGNALNVPAAPTMGQPTNITTTSMSTQFYGNSDGGSPITGWAIERATDAGFSQNVVRIASNGTDNWTGLTPATTYYFRANGSNAIGWSGYSNTVSATTLPAVPPGMTVAASPSGTAATVTLTPPGGVSGVDSYWIDWRVLGTTTWTSANGGPSQTVTGLIPGTTYEWMSSAMIGSYQSPKTAITTLLQPNPSTSPGDYFDGSTAATPDQTYGWTGTANNSTSQAIGQAPAGWMNFGDGNPSSGATGVVARVTGGLFGTYAARITFLSDQTVQTFGGGTDWKDPGRADVTPGATYVGSIHLNPSKSNRVRARLIWINAAGTIFGTPADGDEVVIPAGQWTRLTVTGIAPALAEYAAITFITAPGTGSSLWLSGDTVLMDGAMITLGSLFPYFDGSFTDGGGFDYAWLGTANASQSIREDVPSNAADALTDPDCPPIPAPPRPPVVLDDCIEEVGVWRRYQVVIPATEVSDWIDVLPTFTLTTFGLAERQVRIRIYPNPFNYPISQVDTSSWCAEQIISYLPPNTVMTLDAELQRVFASVAGGGTQSADHLLYGTGGAPASWPVLTCGISYLVSFDTPLDAPAGNTKVDVDLTRRTY